MPKLPDIEYAVTVQGPPNVAQAFGSISDALMGLQKIQHDATMAFAEEQRKTQESEASLILESGLADTEAKLSKPYLTPAEVKSAFPGGAPPEVATILERYKDENAAAVPTHEVGAYIHSQVGKGLVEEARGLIYSPKARAEFERRAAAEALHRNIRVNQAMLSQGAELNAAKDVSLAEARARTAITPGDWAKVYAAIENSGWLSPAQKEKYAAHFAGLQETQGKQRTAAGLAEGALAAGRDGVSPWVDAGKAQEAFEKSVEGKDPLVVEAARQKFTVALDQNRSMRQASDEMPAARLMAMSDRGGALDRTSPDWAALSDVGREKVEARHAANRRIRMQSVVDARRYTAEERRRLADEKKAQNELDDRAAKAFKALELGEQVRLDPRKMSPKELAAALGRPEFANVSDDAINDMVITRRGSEKAWKKDQGVSEQAFLKEVDDLAVGLGYTKKGAATQTSREFRSAMREQYREWSERQPEDGPKKPSVEEKDRMLRTALEYGDKGGWHLSGNKYRWQVKPGEEFTTEGFEDNQPGLKKLGEKGTAPAPASGKVKVRRNGVVGTVTTPLPGDEVLP